MRYRINENHLGIVKPVNREHPAYVALRDRYVQNGKAVPTTPSVVRYGETLCAFYGESNSGGSAWHKDEACPIKNLTNLDPEYRQTDFNCCGGGASSPMTNRDIPPGLEIRTDGGYYWAVLNGHLDGGDYRLHTYCGPGGAGLPGCNVKVKVIGHYRIVRP